MSERTITLPPMAHVKVEEWLHWAVGSICDTLEDEELHSLLFSKPVDVAVLAGDRIYKRLKDARDGHARAAEALRCSLNVISGRR